jgi:hypothetical protein
MEALQGNLSAPAQIAVGRILCGGSPLWPGRPWELTLLRTWPTHRQLAGQRLQIMASLLIKEEQLLAVAENVLRVPVWDEQIQDWASEVVQDLARDMGRALVSDWVRDWARYLARDWTHYLARDWARNWMRYQARDWGRFWAFKYGFLWARDWKHYFLRDWAGDWARDWVRDLARNLATDSYGNLASHPELKVNTPEMAEFWNIEVRSLGRVGPRVFLAHLDIFKDRLVTLFSLACALSLHPEKDVAPLQNVLAKDANLYEPLWPALARHLARCATAADRTLLIDLAQHPEKCAPPLSWGLKYIVRGDILLNDGREISLDTLTDRLGLPRLPYLEEMPEELIVARDDS